MIVALQEIADELAHGQRQVAMDTAVLEGDRRAVLLAKEGDRLAEDLAAERFARDLVAGSGDVPEIPQEHECASAKRILFLAAGFSTQRAVFTSPRLRGEAG